MAVRAPALGRFQGETVTATTPADGAETAATVPRPSDVSGAPEFQADAAVDFHDAGKRFDDRWVLRHLEFSVAPGTIFGLFGPSGSGKTTALRLLLGLIRPDEGELRVLGRPPRSFSSTIRARVGYMPQLFVLYPELSVRENMELAASLYGLGWFRRRGAIRRTLEFVELWEHRGKVGDQLSGGMKRRLQLAAALVHTPELLVVDEPTAGIDPILRAKFWDHFRALRDAGHTIVVTSQYVTEAEYCDQIAFLGRGEIVARGTPDEVRDRALGGDLVEVVTDGLRRDLVEALTALDGVRGATRISYEQLNLIVDRAEEVIPRVLALLNESGVEVKQVAESRPNFDEVFVRLMEQSDVASVE
jgi:ABC-2 type transport system ATP-binding protein